MTYWASDILASLATHEDDLAERALGQQDQTVEEWYDLVDRVNVRKAADAAEYLWHPITGDYVGWEPTINDLERQI